MRHQPIGMYLVILCIILSVGNNYNSIVHSQVINDTGNHNQVEQYPAKQNSHFQSQILTKPILTYANNQTAVYPSRLQAVTSVKANSNSTGFISTWKTTLKSPSSSNTYQITLPLVFDGTYDFNVSWGDGNSNLITSYNQSAITHTYSTSGTYTLNITGTIIGWSFNGMGDAVKLIQIANWGTLRLGNLGYYFSGASNLVLTTTNALDLNGTTIIAGMFICLFVIAIIAIIGISAYVSIAYFEYNKKINKREEKNLKFLNYLKNSLKFKRHKIVTKETLSSKTFDKIEQIIEENKEK